MGNIIKVAILYIKNGKLLMCKKQGLDMLINLGGKLENKETDIQCAEREVNEEAQCQVKNLEYYTTINAPRADEPTSQIELRCYFGELIGEPSPREGDTILGFEYIDKNYPLSRLPYAAQELMKHLIRDNHI